MQGAHSKDFVICSDLTRTFPVGSGTAAVDAIAPSLT